VSVYLSVAPPDGFTRWGEAEWERWLRDHPWEAAERICSRGDWAIFLYQLRAHAERGRKLIEPHLEALINERPLDAQAADDVRAGLAAAREELTQKPASLLHASNNHFASTEDLDAMIAAARNRKGGEPSVADLWTEVLGAVDKVLAAAGPQKRGIYFGNV
jgi:hypothetical protein